jgi:hypothetical protein
MARQTLVPTISFGCLLLAFGGFANADIVQCAGGSGTVTYTDGACESGSNAIRVQGPSKGFIVTLRTPEATVEKPSAFIVAKEAREAAWTKKARETRAVSRDAATLQGARTAMQVDDQVALSSRQEKLVALELRGQQGWFRF